MVKFKRILILVLVLAITGFIWVSWELYRPASAKLGQTIFTVESGQGVNTISKNLHQAGLIHSRLVFETYLWFLHQENKLIAGRYTLNGSMNIPTITNLLVGGKVNQEERLTFIEGWNRQDYADYLDQKGFSGKNFLTITNQASSWQQDYPILKKIPNNMNLEGFLFPDTYQFAPDSDENDIAAKLLANFSKKFSAELIEAVNKQGRNVYDTVILASILEKEVAQAEDRAMVADIFYKRLKAGIGLQSDATISFITGKNNPRSSLNDLEIDSPYNTYKYRGLPPGPICNPGLDSIQAAIFPQANDYYYFLTDSEGAVHYAKTFEEHKVNREKYLE